MQHEFEGDHWSRICLFGVSVALGLYPMQCCGEGRQTRFKHFWRQLFSARLYQRQPRKTHPVERRCDGRILPLTVPGRASTEPMLSFHAPPPPSSAELCTLCCPRVSLSYRIKSIFRLPGIQPGSILASNRWSKYRFGLLHPFLPL